jgi:hypothetical protein
VWVAVSDEVCMLENTGEKGPPKQKRGTIDKPHTLHTREGGIYSSNARSSVGNQYGEMCWVGVQ